MKSSKNPGECLLHSTSQISWQFLYSGILRAAQLASEPKSLFSLEALPNVVLGCCALEAFCNEFSSTVSALLFELSSNPCSVSEDDHENFIGRVGISEETCQKVASIKMNKAGSSRERYKNICKTLNITKPQNYNELCNLVQLRDALVHFRNCDLRVVSKNYCITYDHDMPEFYGQLKKIKYRGSDLVFVADVAQNGSDHAQIPWTTRVSTPAVSLWAMEVVLLASIHIIVCLPEGKLKQKIVEFYRPNNDGYMSLFHWGLSLIDEAAPSIV